MHYTIEVRIEHPIRELWAVFSSSRRRGEQKRTAEPQNVECRTADVFESTLQREGQQGRISNRRAAENPLPGEAKVISKNAKVTVARGQW